MSAKCPLCLKLLDSRDYLVRFCPQHPAETARLPYSAASFTQIVTCSNPHCHQGNTMESQVFLRHEGCACKNVYFRNGTVTVPEFGEYDKPPKIVRHWIFGTLQEAARVFPNADEMWFPQALFRACCPRGGRTGALVKLCGASYVGKTILATMALNPYSYITLKGAPSEPDIGIDEYVYVSPVPSPTEPPEAEFARALYPISQLRLESPPGRWVQPTAPKARRVMAVFLRLSSRPADGGAISQSEDSLLRYMAEEFAKWFKPSTLEGKENMGGRETMPTHSVVAFYDTAGEENQAPNVEDLRKMEECMDAVAILIDANHLSCFGRTGIDPRTKPDSIPVAVERIEHIASSRLRRCLVVTKLDQVRKQVSREVGGHLENIASGSAQSAAQDRDLLRQWLAAGTTPSEKRLAKKLDSGDIDEVFFTWAEGLDQPWEGTPPHGVGVRRLIRWCLPGRRALATVR